MYDFDLSNTNTRQDEDLNLKNYLLNYRIQNRYYSPHNFQELKNKLTRDEIDCSFSLFHNNVLSINRNLENRQTHILDELNFHFNIIGVTENLICGVMYRQHKSPDRFQSYFEETTEKLTSTGKQLYIVGDFNIHLLKFETSRYSHDFLLALQSCFFLIW